MRNIRRFFPALVALAVVGMLLPQAATAQVASDEVELVTPATGVVVGASETSLDLDIFVKNRTTSRKVVGFELDGAPAAWNVAVWHRFQNFKVTESAIQPTAADGEGERFRLRMNIPKEREAGQATFTLRLLSDTGELYDSARFTITVPEAEAEAEGEVKFRSDFPSLAGPSSSTFEFEIVVINETGAERSFNLSASTPPDWNASFVPAFGEEKVISSVSVPNNLNERVKVRVRPSFFAESGDYTIPITISADGYNTQGMLNLKIVGRGELQLTTPTGNVSFKAKAGKATTSKIRLVNRGTAEMSDIKLAADPPSGDWQVDFQAATVGPLPVDNMIDVDVTVTPPQDAIPGDYIVTVRGTHPDSRVSTNLRVTVEQSTIWGWLGIVLVLVVIGGLVGLFFRLGRR